MLYLGYGLAVLCFVISGILAHQKREGWGWFLIVAVLLVRLRRQ